MHQDAKHQQKVTVFPFVKKYWFVGTRVLLKGGAGGGGGAPPPSGDPELLEATKALKEFFGPKLSCAEGARENF